MVGWCMIPGGLQHRDPLSGSAILLWGSDVLPPAFGPWRRDAGGRADDRPVSKASSRLSTRLTFIDLRSLDRSPLALPSGGSGREPPHPALWALILGGQKLRFFDPLRCKVQGGWGGSAHYPDPTAQSVEPVYAERRPRAREPSEGAEEVAGGRRGGSQPGGAVSPGSSPGSAPREPAQAASPGGRPGGRPGRRRGGRPGRRRGGPG